MLALSCKRNYLEICCESWCISELPSILLIHANHLGKFLIFPLLLWLPKGTMAKQNFLIKDVLVLFNGWRPQKYLAHSLWPRGKVTKNSETQNEWATILKKWKVHCVTVVNQEGMLEASICRASSSSCTDAGIGDAYSALMLFQVCKCFCK